MVSIKLGNSLFNQEKRINELKEENEKIKQELNQLSKEFHILKTSNQEGEKNGIETKNQLKIKELELDMLRTKYNKLQEEYQLQTQQHNILIQSDSEKGIRILSLNKQIELLNQELLRSQSDELRLKSEINRLERNITALDSEKEDLNKAMEKKIGLVVSLEKNIQNKDKYLCILLKEKDRLIKPEEQDRSKELRKRDLKNVETNVLNPKQNEKNPVNLQEEDNNSYRNKILHLEKELVEKTEYVAKIEKENFQLMTRVRNMKLKQYQ